VVSAETTTLVIYDCENDRIREKLASACLDYGLERVQYSAFMGKLSRSMREELFMKLGALMGESPSRIIVQPICDQDLAACRIKEVKMHLLGHRVLDRRETPDGEAQQA
jgi:CRISPR-associated protein Cas2